MDSRIRMAGVALVILAVAIGAGIYSASVWPPQPGEIAGIGIALTLVLLGLAGIWTMWDSHRSGQPLADEMTKRLNHKAGYYSWIATIYIALFVGWIIDGVPGAAPRHGATAVLLLSALTYFVVLFGLKAGGRID